MPFQDISIKDFNDKLKYDTLIIDIRDKDSYNQANIPNAKNYNSEDIMKLIEKEKKDINIVVYCYHGNSSQKVASFLSGYGFKKVYTFYSRLSKKRYFI